MTITPRRRRAHYLCANWAALFLLSLLAGCGGGGGEAPPAGNPGSPAPGRPAVMLPPIITSQPADQVVALGQTTTLTVAVSGAGPLTYEWTRNGVVIAGALGSSYTVPAAKAGDSGAVWRVSVANADGVVVSRPALITVGGSGERTFIGEPVAYSDQSDLRVWSETSMAFDDAGNLHVPVLGGVFAISPRGVATGKLGLSSASGRQSPCFWPGSVAFDRSGNLYLLCTTALYKITPGGEQIMLAGSASLAGNADGKGTAARFGKASALAVSDSGVVYVADNGNGNLRRIDPDGTVSTVAGSGLGTTSIDGTGPAARFQFMRGLAVDGQGNVLLSDGPAIRKVTPAGVVTTFAGKLNTWGENDGSLAQARFSIPEGIVLDTAGNIYIADANLATIRKVTPDGQVVTVAGKLKLQGSADGLGAGAMFSRPTALAMDKLGNIYVHESAGAIRKMTPAGEVTSFYGNTSLPASPSTVMARGHEGIVWFVRGMSINPAGELLYSSYDAIWKATGPGEVRLFAQSNSTLFTFAPGILALPMPIGEQFDTLAAGRNLTYAMVGQSVAAGGGQRLVKFDASGTLTQINNVPAAPTTAARSLTGMAADADDNGYVALVRSDLNRAFVYRIPPTGAAIDLLEGRTAYPGRFDLSFSVAGGVAVDRNKNVYVADRGNHTVLKISPAGVVSTLAGLPGVRGQADGTGAAARFSSPWSIAVDGNGNVFVYDSGNYTIRKITPDGAVSTIAGTAGRAGSKYTGNDGLLPVVNALATDASGTLYVATDYGIIKIVP